MRVILLFSILILVHAGCEDPVESDTTSGTTTGASTGTTTNIQTPDWTDATHSKKADPNYTTVFPQDKANKIEITMTAADWTAIQTDMKSLYGFAFGAGEIRGGGAFPSSEPKYVAVSLKMNGLEWYKVGFRLKGNSTLSQSWGSGIYKLPFRLNFDEFEDTYPAIDDQRFFGFKELSFSPGAKDNSLLREKIGADIFRKAGIPSAQTAFYRVYINFGSGLKYCGVYTAVEVVDNTMVKDQFGEDKGNIYKPESYFSSFVQSDFEKKNNETLADYTDVKALITSLNSGLRTTNPEQWRSELEATLNVNHFLKWLAVNSTMTNWDTYGAMAHNYYLYNHPTNKLTWIPWDNNECLANRNGPSGSSVNLSLSSVSNTWPLIRYLADDAVYYAQYKKYVREFANTAFVASDIQNLMTTYHTLISPYVIGPEETESGKYTQLTSTTAFTNELTTLKNYVASRHTEVNSFVPN